MSGGFRTSSNEFNQGDLFSEKPSALSKKRRVGFREPGEACLMVGSLGLRQYLETIDDKFSLMLFEFLKSLDWSEFEKAYTGYGRNPYPPRLMMGIILYGIIENHFTLRSLERLATKDLGCMWVAAGISPDHSSIGKFIQRHEALLTTGFFESLTSKILKLTGTNARECAVDGTLVQAAASRYRTVQREALEKKLENSRQADPDDAEAAKNLERYEAADKALAKREEARSKQRKPTKTLRVSTTEPEAPVQPLKNKSYAPAYKPSVIANNERIITAMAVDPTSESAVVEQMIEQSDRISGEPMQELMGDAGYCNKTVIDATLERDISLLAPETSNGKTPQPFAKQSFKYDESQDIYVCPAGQPMQLYTKKTKGYARYKGTACEGCELRGQCIKGKKTKNRTIKRFPVDDAKDVLREVMANPRAQDRYRQRKAIVEPVFAYIAGCLGWRRFRRNGLKGVRTEFALYAAANNVARLFALVGRSGGRLDAVFLRFLVIFRRWLRFWADGAILGKPAHKTSF